MNIDPIMLSILGIALALLFTQAAWGKLRFFSQFQQILHSYQLFPAVSIAITAGVITGLEIITALSLSMPSLRSQGALMAALLLTCYAMGMGINLLRHRRQLDCGCHLHAGQSQPITWFLVGRNLIVAAVTLTLLLPQLERTLTAYDFSIILLGTGVCALLYSIVDGLIGNHVSLSQEI
jgi:Methylamine utilisation protein MauE